MSASSAGGSPAAPAADDEDAVSPADDRSGEESASSISQSIALGAAFAAAAVVSFLAGQASVWCRRRGDDTVNQPSLLG